MGFFGDIGLAYSFSIVLGCLIALTFIAAFIRLYWKKRKLAKDTLKQDLEAAEKATRNVLQPECNLGEGDLFGVRAIEKGFYGGVSQSTPTTAANSPQSSPTIVAIEGSPIQDGISAGSSIPEEFSLSGSGNTRAVSRSRSQSLRLQPSDAELNGRRNHDPSVTMSSYIPPLPHGTEDPTNTQHTSENITVSQPSLPSNFNPQVQSYAQWRLSHAGKGTAKPILRPESQFSGTNSKPNGVYVSRGTNTEPETHVPSLPFSIFNSDESIEGNTQLRGSRRRSRSISAFDEHRQFYLLRDMPGEFVLPLVPPPIPLRNPSRQSRNSESGDSSSETESGRPHLRYSKSANGSATEASIRSSRRRSRSQPAAVEHVRHSSSTSGKRLRNVRDSLRHNRETSSEIIAEQRISRQRDTIHYDPRPLHRSVSGAVVGRSIDFDHPRSSPFDSSEIVSQETSPEPASSSLSDSRSRPSVRSVGNQGRAKNLSLEYTHWMMKSNVLGDVGERRSSLRHY